MFSLNWTNNVLQNSVTNHNDDRGLPAAQSSNKDILVWCELQDLRLQSIQCNDMLGYSNYCQQYSAMSQQQVMADINDKTVRTSHCLLTGGALSAFFVFLLILLI